MTHKNNILPVAIIGIVILFVVIGGVIILNLYNYENNKPQEFDTNNTNFSSTYFENISEKRIEFNGTSTFEELKQIIYPQFEVGEKYFYHMLVKIPDQENTIFMPEEYDTVIEVIKIDKINKSNYYILKSQNVSFYHYILKKDENGVWRKIRSESHTSVVRTDENGTQEEVKSETSDVYKYEGCVFGVNKEDGKRCVVDVPSLCPVLDNMFAEWMLYIDKGVRWVEKSNLSGLGTDKSNSMVAETEWAVADVEKINERDCFKVIVTTKQELMGRHGKKISSEIVTYWIDKKKRILVKMEKRENGVLTEMIELKNYEKP